MDKKQQDAVRRMLSRLSESKVVDFERSAREIMEASISEVPPELSAYIFAYSSYVFVVAEPDDGKERAPSQPTLW